MTLSDLDTTNIGIIAYWNAENHGSGEVDPTDVLSHNRIQSYTQETNGVEGIFTVSYGSGPGHNRNFNFRVKSDGWFVVYFDRTNNYGTALSTDSDRHGYLDMIDSWADANSNINTFPDTKHEYVIYQLYNELSNTSTFNYSKSDVGYYNYEHSSASTVTQMDEMGRMDNHSMNGGISYASGTTRHFHAVGGVTNETDGYRGSLYFAGTKVMADNNAMAGIRDVLATSSMPNAETVYNHGNSNWSNNYSDYAKLSHLTFWS